MTRIILQDASPERGWRISVATIESDGPFSDFTGFDRTFVPIDHPVALQIDGCRNVVEPLSSIFFAGESSVTCTLAQRPSHDLNVMTRRDMYTHRVEILGNGISITVLTCAGGMLHDEAVCTVGGFTRNPLTVKMRFG
ncbi:MAG: HutD family protein [Candidatus Eremiobacteraeota bacterium]|nr:HutD family protein [Candidatus Eremiobacteraeota bacterium]